MDQPLPTEVMTTLLIGKFPVFYAVLRFIILFTTILQEALSQLNPAHILTPFFLQISFDIISHL
jgi:hypothetical protein